MRLIKLHYLVNVETGRVNMSDDPFSTIRPPIGRMEPDQILCNAVDWADVMLEYECLELPGRRPQCKDVYMLRPTMHC